MITRNSYALNQGFVLEHAPVKPKRAILEGNMGGDKKPSHRYFERGGHGKTVIAECTLTEEAVRRVLKTTLDDLADLAFVGTHGAVASGMQSVAFTPATAIAALFIATGQDVGMVGTSSMAHGTAHKVDGGLHATIRLPGLEVATIGGGTTLPYASAWLRLLGCDGAGQGLPLRADRRRGDARARDLRVGGDGHRRARRTSTRPTSSGAACAEPNPAAPRPCVLGLRRQPGRHPPPSPRLRRESTATRRRSPSASATRPGRESSTEASSAPRWTRPAASSPPGTASRP